MAKTIHYFEFLDNISEEEVNKAIEEINEMNLKNGEAVILDFHKLML